ncbi:hypothetical protein D3C84_1225900 [compost metagenome]
MTKGNDIRRIQGLNLPCLLGLRVSMNRPQVTSATASQTRAIRKSKPTVPALMWKMSV